MQTEVVKACGDTERDGELLKKAALIIKEGGLVAIPTETVYGLAGDALNPESAKRIYAAKGRPSDNPLIVHIAEWEGIKKIALEIPDSAEKLHKAFLPGPLTMVLKKTDIVPFETTGGLSTVAVRFPSHPVAMAFIKASGGFIAAPSANRSGRPSCTTAEHVYEDMKGRIPLIIDGGPVGIGIESTIVDLTEDIPVLLRPGYVSIEALREVLGEVKVDPSIDGAVAAAEKHGTEPETQAAADGGLAAGAEPRTINGVTESLHPKAPGMKYTHYAPKGELFIVKGEEGRVISAINGFTADIEASGRVCAVLSSGETASYYRCKIVRAVGRRSNEEEIARNLFKLLREMDSLGVDTIYTEEFNTPRLGMAVMNRLIRAAGHKVIEV